MWGAVFLLAVAGTTVTADPIAIFPEQARAGAARIVSGWEAERGQFPHQLSIRMVNPAGGVSSCGGTIIDSKWGLTAAHCTAGRVTLIIRFGAVNLTQPTVMIETTKYYNHPLYNEALPSVVQPNDIGLINFGRNIIFSETIQPIRLQRSSARNENYEGTRATAAGWGRTWTNGPSPENMNWVHLSLTSNIQCSIAYGGSSIIQDSTICARGYNVTSQSTCSGDSGGVLSIIDIDGNVSQVGISSFVSGSGCHTDIPAGFIRPGFYHDWYTQVTGIKFDWEYTPDPTISTSPDPSTGTSPGPSTSTSPGSTTGTSPGPSTSTSPNPTTRTSPDPPTSTSLNPPTSTSPGSTTGTSPGPSTSTSPNPTTRTSPDPPTSTSLNPPTSTSPGSTTGTSPGPSTSTSPGSTTGTSPGPSTSTSPNPTTRTSPDPPTSTSLNPPTSTSPGSTTGTSAGPSTSTRPDPPTSTTVDSEASSDESSSESDSSPDSSDLS